MHSKYKAITCLMFALSLLCSVTPALPQQGLRQPEDFCKLGPTTHRETVVYVESKLLKNTAEIRAFATALTQRAELAPREQLRIILIADASAKEAFSKCWPALLESELQAPNRAKQSWKEKILSLLDESLEARVKDSQDFYRANIVRDVSKSLFPGGTDAFDLVRSLSLDKSRLADGRNYRIFIYTSLKSSALRQIIQSAPQPGADFEMKIATLFREYPLDFKGAEVFIWGPIEPDQLRQLVLVERLWKAYFQHGFGLLRSIGTDLPTATPTLLRSRVEFEGNWKTSEGSGRARFAFSADTAAGKLSNTWLTIQTNAAPYPIAVDGTFSCRSENDCEVKGKVVLDVPLLRPKPYFQAGDLVDLRGSSINLGGSLKPPGPAVFPKGGQVEYGITLVRRGS